MKRIRRTIDRLEYFTIMLTGTLAFVLSGISFWCFTKLMIEEVVFVSFGTAFLITGISGCFIDMAFKSLKRGIRNA